MQSIEPEAWMPIEGYEGLYEISSYGRVRSVERLVPRAKGMYPVHARILRPSRDRKGYQFVNLWKGNVAKNRKIHRLVARAFVPGYAPGLWALHSDGDNQNNVPSNLRWGDSTDNTLDMVKHGVHNHARKTHCKNDHALEGDNVRLDRNGARVCRACQKASQDAFQARKKQIAHDARVPRHATRRSAQ